MLANPAKEWKFYTAGGLQWRAQDRNDVPLIPPVNKEISLVRRKYDASRVQFTHAYQAQVRYIWFPLGIAGGQFYKVGEVTAEVE
jgi:hypothetical protein